jgi:hypothetical protein
MQECFYTRFTKVVRTSLVAFLLLFAISMHAAVQVNTISEAGLVASGSEREIQLPQFDPSLGVLQSVGIELNARGAFIQGFGNFSGSNRELSSHQDLLVTLALPSHDQLTALMQTSARGSGTSNGIRVEPVTASAYSLITSSTGLMAFTGSGLVDLFLSTEGSGRTSAGQMNILACLWAARADLTLTYNYTAVPETGTWAAAVFAVLVTICGGRRAFPTG